MSKFIPSFHFEPPKSKLTAEWCMKAINYYYFNTNNKNLLHNKNVKEIEDYSAGSFDMNPFKRMYKSMKKVLEASADPNMRENQDTTGLDWTPLPLIPTKLNSAVSIVQKIPVEITCTALDPLAAEKKKEDITFLKNKKDVEADLQEISDQLQLGEVNLGGTKHSDVEYSDSPYGLDLNEPDELDVFINLLYSLNVESAFETALQQFYELKNIQQIKLLEIKDQYKFGVSVHRAFPSAITGLPDAEYIYPQNMEVPDSSLPDFSDNTHRFMPTRLTVQELFNYFGNEICDKETLEEILNDRKTGYAANNNESEIDLKNWTTYKINLIYCEVKSIDSVGIANRPNSRRNSQYITDSDDAKICTEKIWGQNTYGFWWLKNTHHCFGIHRLDYAHRTIGQEAYQNFSTNIYKSQEKSAVELAIGQNKRAQVADIKMQHTIKMSLPPGKYIDLKYLRGALSGLVDEHVGYTLEDLLHLAMEHNWHIGDTTGFEGKDQGQFMPVKDIAGGLKRDEIAGYMEVILDATMKIGQFTGINDQLTGQGTNPEGLIGLQKLLINSSLNALYYVNEAIREQYQKMMTVWASVVKQAIERGGKTKKAIVSMVGKKKVSLIDGIDDVPLHQIGVVVRVSQREEERAEFEERLHKLEDNGVISSADIFLLRSIQNPKDAFALLAVKEKQWRKRQDKIQEQDRIARQQEIQQMGQNTLQAEEAKNDGKVKQIYSKADADMKVRQLASQLGLNEKQVDAMIKQSLQSNRMRGQVEKSIKTLQAKQELQNQNALQK